MTAIAILGEYTPAFAPHAATTAAIAHARARLRVAVDAEWMSTAAVDETLFERFDALWIAPGSPYKDLEQTLWTIREARQRGVPCMGTCGGWASATRSTPSTIPTPRGSSSRSSRARWPAARCAWPSRRTPGWRPSMARP